METTSMNDEEKKRAEQMALKDKLLKAVDDHTITLNDMLKKCAEWTLEFIHEYKFEDIPLKPRAVLEFEEIPQDERRMLNNDYFKDHPAIMQYYDEVYRVRKANNALMGWLVECSRLVTKPEDLKLISDKIDEAQPGQL